MQNLIPAREIDRDCLILMMERCEGGSAFKKQRQVDRIRKAYSRGELFIPPNEEEQHRWWRCEARMMLGDYSDWSGWEYRDQWAATLWHWRDTKPYEIPPWNGLFTDCLYIIGEQGIGDEIFFSSCLPDAKKRCKRLIFECQPRLVSMMARSFPDIEVIPSRMTEDNKRLKRDLPDEATAWFALADLPRFFRTNLATFHVAPHIKPDENQVVRFKSYQNRAGLSWRGAQGTVKEIMSLDGLSLQYDLAWDEDVETVEGLDVRNDLEGLCGLLANLSHVVTTSTSAAHFAAAIGVETHVIIADPKTGVRGNIFPWRWICGNGGKTPWYPSARSYRSFDEFRRRSPDRARFKSAR